MPTERDANFGQVAVTLGLVSPAEVIAALRALREEKSSRSLADVLLERKSLRPEDVARVEAGMRGPTGEQRALSSPPRRT